MSEHLVSYSRDTPVGAKEGAVSSEPGNHASIYAAPSSTQADIELDERPSEVRTVFNDPQRKPLVCDSHFF